MKTRVYSLVAGTALTLMLAGCGGSDSTPPASTTGTGTGTTTPVTSTIDSFTQYVLNLFGANADTAEPQLIDAAAVTVPETTEPVALNP
ncbi:hypothetical protein ACO0LF_06485 [Undibacterium sp. Di27W]|uniref:hypothetical protein n=1 Tax=Undibacterium sp. Di27W TaxID=3413036 RepID=UPI003BF2D4A4